MIVIKVAFFSLLGCVSIYGIAQSIKWNRRHAFFGWSTALVSQIAWATCAISHTG